MSEIRRDFYAHPVSGTSVTLLATGEQLGANEVVDKMVLTLHTSLATISSNFFRDNNDGAAGVGTSGNGCSRYEVIIRRKT